MNDGVKILLVLGLVGGAGFLAYKLLSKKETKKKKRAKATATIQAQNDISKIAAPDKIEVYTYDDFTKKKSSKTVPIGYLSKVSFPSNKYNITVYQGRLYLCDKEVKWLIPLNFEADIPITDNMFGKMKTFIPTSFDLALNSQDGLLYLIKSSDTKFLFNSVSRS